VADIEPLRGIRYDPARAGEMATLVAPPYDVISKDLLERLHDRSPYNAVRLILNREADPHASAAAAWSMWRRDGVLCQDDVPSLYFYAQTFELPRVGTCRRDGIITAMRLERLGDGVLPHERTMEGPKADRLKLIRACRANLSPIFGLVSCPGATLRDLVPAVRAPALVSVVDDQGVRHELWRVTDPGAVSRLQQVVKAEPVVIADGHHRYETALAYRDEMRRAHPDAGPAAAFEYVLTYLSSIDEPGLVVLPTHRVLRDARGADVARVLADLREDFEVVEYPTDRVQAFLARLYEGPSQIGCVLPGRLVVLTLRGDPARRLPQRSAACRSHAVVILHDLVLPRLAPTPLEFTHEDASALAAVSSGEAGAAFLVPAPSARDVRAVCRSGATLPEKSTYFHPKLLTGLVFRALDP
jgi:uncharacterized protein (DUF1015 family)